jgi:hypothetical protein
MGFFILNVKLFFCEKNVLVIDAIVEIRRRKICKNGYLCCTYNLFRKSSVLVIGNIQVNECILNFVEIDDLDFRRLLFVTEISFLGLYEIDWRIEYEELKEEPVLKPNLGQIQILTKVIVSKTKNTKDILFLFQEPKKTGAMKSTRSYGKMIKYRNIAEARVKSISFLFCHILFILVHSR